VIIGTCNRTEIYAAVDQLHTGEHFIKGYLANWFGLDKKAFNAYLYVKAAEDAMIHLFRVVCGLDSMVLGETQILGQVRDAFLLAQETKTTGTLFNRLFKQAITLGKRAQSETAIGQHAVSVSYAAVELAKNIFGQFNKKRVLIVGAGEMSELTVKHLHSNGVLEVMVVNRTMERAEELARRFNGRALGMNRIAEGLKEADIVISSTGANHYVLTAEQVRQAMKSRRGRPLFFIDIAVPRDLDPAIHQLDNVFLYDIDDLQDVVQTNLRERQKEAEKLDAVIAGEVADFQEWVRTLGVVPLISALREKALAIQGETMRSIENKLPHLSERDLKVLRKHTKSIINQMMRDPILQIKELAIKPNADEALKLFSQIFALDGYIKQEKSKENKQELSQVLLDNPISHLPVRS
jgi:glutamyl-tRNA reductase